MITSSRLINNNLYKLLGLVVIGLLFYWGFASFSERRFIIDEYHHFFQFKMFVEGTWKLDPEIPNLPGYHLLLAALGRFLNFNDFQSTRIATCLIGLASIIIFYLTSNSISKSFAVLKTIQFACLPILFPFFFLVYTDVTALALILLSVLMINAKRTQVSIIILILSIFARQSNIVFLGFFLLYLYLEDYGWQLKYRNIYQHCTRYWLGLLAIILFIIFVLANGGVSVGDVKHHPTSKLYSGNIFFILFTTSCLMLPAFLYEWRQLWRNIKQVKYSLPILLVSAGIFFLSFRVDHPLNSYQNHIRNQILSYFTSSLLLEITFFSICLFSIFGLWALKLYKKTYYLIYPTIILFLAPIWLIEQRYYLIPFTLILLYRRPINLYVELIQTILYLITSIWLTILITSSSNFFL